MPAPAKAHAAVDDLNSCRIEGGGTSSQASTASDNVVFNPSPRSTIIFMLLPNSKFLINTTFHMYNKSPLPLHLEPPRDLLLERTIATTCDFQAKPMLENLLYSFVSQSSRHHRKNTSTPLLHQHHCRMRTSTPHASATTPPLLHQAFTPNSLCQTPKAHTKLLLLLSWTKS
ncbi:hypothetical protein LOK49_LG12G03065 [Camellia lanceoleosa]|uniref:Uncharacterized protein n=1 Tax=Camellia lanceoleosa TaxID=1840588 RepID=A0ACC0FVH1_9ERIC|nr:hypothetical protein LOK49_LG12G03065 [Camellia lanceoleosa]